MCGVGLVRIGERVGIGDQKVEVNGYVFQKFDLELFGFEDF